MDWVSHNLFKIHSRFHFVTMITLTIINVCLLHQFKSSMRAVTICQEIPVFPAPSTGLACRCSINRCLVNICEMNEWTSKWMYRQYQNILPIISFAYTSHALIPYQFRPTKVSYVLYFRRQEKERGRKLSLQLLSTCSLSGEGERRQFSGATYKIFS